MIIADVIFYFLFIFVLSLAEANMNIILSAALGLAVAVVFTDLQKSRVFGRVAQVITSLLMTISAIYVVEVLTTDAQTAHGIMVQLYREQRVYFAALLILMTAGFTWLHFQFVRIGEGPMQFLFARFFGRRAAGDNAGGRHSYGRKHGPTVEMLRDELDKYHTSFTRLKLLIDEVTRSDAFRAGGDIAFDSISAAMDMVRKNNSEVESLYEKFISADKAERENIISYIYGVNRDMIACEDDLRKAYEELKANYIPGSEKKRESSSDNFRRRERTYSSSGPTTNEERVSMFFNGCETREQLEKRYRSLAKTFHPDMESGDTETMALINREYDRLQALLK